MLTIVSFQAGQLASFCGEQMAPSGPGYLFKMAQRRELSLDLVAVSNTTNIVVITRESLLTQGAAI